jgi:hypothetical protein
MHEQAPISTIGPHTMSKSSDSSIPSDICLLLRADAEQCWLSHEVIPVLRELEAHEPLPEEEVCAALAYLEAMWDEATSRAQETDAAHAHLRAREDEATTLSGPAGRYHAAVRLLRGVVAERVTPLVRSQLAEDHIGFAPCPSQPAPQRHALTCSRIRLAPTER